MDLELSQQLLNHLFELVSGLVSRDFGIIELPLQCREEKQWVFRVIGPEERDILRAILPARLVTALRLG